jgi:hypothetical protein
MNEVWVKMTVWRRYLVMDEDIEAATTILKTDADQGNNIVAEIFDTNLCLEYDEEKPVKPVNFKVQKIN